MKGSSDSLPSIGLRPQGLTSLETALDCEWLLTNGLGGYASSTSLGVNTRKYHGILVASLDPPRRRTLFVAKLDEDLEIYGVNHRLGTNDFDSGLQPEGYKYLSSFTLHPFPTYNYNVFGVELKKTICMVYGRNASIVKYILSNQSSANVKLRVYPMITCRHIYSTLRGNRLEWSSQQSDEDIILFKPQTKSETLITSFNIGRYHRLDEWLEKVLFRVDCMRRESCFDDYYIPGYVTVDACPHEDAVLKMLFVAESDEEKAVKALNFLRSKDLDSLIESEKLRLKNTLKRFSERYRSARISESLKWLILAANSFLVENFRDGSKAVIAGYHWFGEWGRDTFISLPGLTLVTGRFKEAKRILTRYSNLVKDGLIPNAFPDAESSKPEYSSIDASLWYIDAVYQYLKYSGDFNYVRENLLQNLESIIKGLIEGENPYVRYCDGLLVHDSRMTWMDASVEGVPVTPRKGKAVEIQALWYNALKIMEALSRYYNLRGKSEFYGSLANKAKESFLTEFWNEKLNCLYDVVDLEGKDPSVRPNQIFTVSLDFSMLDESMSLKVVDKVWKELWAIYGLRTLSRDDPNYVGRYIGGWAHRDRTYHNGTVWAWLTGSFIKAFLKVRRYEADWRRFAYRNFLEPLLNEQIYRYGLGTIGEIFDGEWPHRPDGCISQAWSVAEILRAYVEDILYVRPPYKEVLS